MYVLIANTDFARIAQMDKKNKNTEFIFNMEKNTMRIHQITKKSGLTRTKEFEKNIWQNLPLIPE